jgi:hypothetical protein
MPGRKLGVAALFAATCAAVAIGAAPMAAADDECDPSVAVCDSTVNDSPGNVEINDSPPASAVDQYPSDDEWYFNPAGGGTALQSGGGSHSGGGGGGGGGGHR